MITCTLDAIDATIMHRILTLLACTTALTPTPGRTRDAALTQTRVRTRVMTDGEILRRSAEVGPLVRAFSVGQRGRGSGVSTLNVAEASALKAATDELIAKRKKCGGSVIVAQKARGTLVGFALVNDDVLETVAVAVDERGRVEFSDGVAFAPHRFVDVKDWDVDFYAFSLYKTYGPHIGLLYGKKDLLLEAQSWHHYFIPKTATSYKMNPAGPQHEIIASLSGISDYINAVAAEHLDEAPNELFARTEAVYELFTRHEADLANVFVDWISSKDGARLIGRETAAPEERAPTFSFVAEGKASQEIAEAAANHKVGIRHGDFYAKRLIEVLGIDGDDGVVRCSMAHYTTLDEAQALVETLDRIV